MRVCWNLTTDTDIDASSIEHKIDVVCEMQAPTTFHLD